MIKSTYFKSKFFGGRVGTPLPQKIFFSKMLVLYYVIKNTYFGSKNFRGRVGTPWEPPPKKICYWKFSFSSSWSKVHVLRANFLGVGRDPLPPKIFFFKNVSFVLCDQKHVLWVKKFQGSGRDPWEPQPPKKFFYWKFSFSSTWSKVHVLRAKFLGVG